MNKHRETLFFLLYSLSVGGGGVEKSFLDLMSTLSPKSYEIHLGLIQKKGEYLDKLPKHIIIHECCKGLWRELNDPPINTIKLMVKNKKFLSALTKLFGYLYSKLTKDDSILLKLSLKCEPSIDILFDKAFAYAGPAALIDYYICKKIRAKNKFGWVHFDVSKFYVDKSMINKLYPTYNRIFIVSEEGKIKFDKLFPTLASKTEVRHNIISKKQIHNLAAIGHTFSDGYQGKKILTVGRLSKEKGQDITIDALRILIDKGYDVKWYYLGDGYLKNYCIEKAKKLGLSDRVEFIGLDTNPYRYMKDCDIYVQPSRHEGYCITLAEARCFKVPIISTNFTGAEEQLKYHPNSIICGLSAVDIAREIMKFL